MYTRSQAKKKNTEDIKMASSKDKTPSNVDKVFIETSELDTPHDDVEGAEAPLTSTLTTSKSKSTSKADDTVDLSHGLAYGYGYGAETSSSTAAMMGAKSKYIEITVHRSNHAVNLILNDNTVSPKPWIGSVNDAATRPSHPIATIAFHQRHEFHLTIVFRGSQHRRQGRKMVRIIFAIHRL
jgi:hypothetical protein